MLVPPASYPSFRLQSQRGDIVTSANLVGWSLLYWYPKADTPGCTAQAQGLRDQIEGFGELGCTVFGVSFDTPGDNAAFAGKYHLPFTLLSDADHALAEAVGASEPGSDYPRRIAHLVDPTGTVRFAYEVSDPAFFAETVLDDLESVTD